MKLVLDITPDILAEADPSHAGRCYLARAGEVAHVNLWVRENHVELKRLFGRIIFTIPQPLARDIMTDVALRAGVGPHWRTRFSPTVKPQRVILDSDGPGECGLPLPEDTASAFSTYLLREQQHEREAVESEVEELVGV